MTSRTTRFFIALLIALVSTLHASSLTAAAAPQPARTAVFVDTDIGVDDAVAVAWLLKNSNANILGFTTVAGNTSVENATHNLLTLLDAAERTDIPVAIGAAAPLQYNLSRLAAFVHGPTGLWFSQVRHDIDDLPRDAPAAIAAAARANPGMTLLTLGPLTNVALAAQRFPADLAGVRIIALVGAQRGGNRTPVSEANAFVDPQALEVVLESGLDVTLVTLDSFSQVTFDSTKFPERLAKRGGAVGQLLADPVQRYFASQTGGAGGQASIPDAVAAIYALDSSLATTTSALAEVSTGAGVTRGQTIIVTDPGLKITMIASDEEMTALVDRLFSDPNFDLQRAMGEILSRRPDNADFVTAVKARDMAQQLERDLIRSR